LKFSTVTIIILLFSISGTAQERPYEITFINGANTSVFKPILGKSDSLTFFLLAEDERSKLVERGFLIANLDSLYCQSQSCFATIFVGEQFHWSQVNTAGFPPGLLSKAGFRNRDFINKPINLEDYSRLVYRIITISANTGYPFATVTMDSSLMSKTEISGTLNYIPGQQVKNDTLSISNGFIKPSFMSAHLGIKKGSVFNLDQFNSIEKRLSRMNYCQLAADPELNFSNGLAHTRIELTPVKANRIDAIIGLLPNQNGKQMMVTGFVDLDLQNLFKSGKRLTFLWRQFDQKSQILKLAYQHPNLFKSPVGLGLRFDLLKQDTTFLSRNFVISASLETKSAEMAIVMNFLASRVLGILPLEMDKLELSDFNLQYYGFDFRQTTLDDPINPIEGYNWSLGINVGSKQVIENASIPAEAYDSLKMNTVQLKFDLSGAYNQPLGSVFVAHLGMSAGSIINESTLFLNDLYRLGGINSLRGFNDLELFASSFMLFKIEARLLIGDKSRIFLFYDQAFTNNNVVNYQDAPFGFGAGLLIGLGSGTLQLAYALGKSNQQSLSLNQAKIHLGYVAKF